MEILSKVSKERSRNYDTEIAAVVCDTLEIEGFRGWFIPSIDELAILIKNRFLIGGFAKYGTYISSTAWSDYRPFVFSTSDSTPSYYGYDKSSSLLMRPIKTVSVTRSRFNLIDSNQNYEKEKVLLKLKGLDIGIPIGSQIWMKQNLDVSRFRNGDLIPHISSAEEWKTTKSPAWCYYNNDSLVGKQNGKLYNWYAVTDPRGIAPKGWHVPTIEEVELLATTLGGAENAGLELKAVRGWEGYGARDRRGKGLNGTNSSGFNAFPVGGRGANGEFVDSYEANESSYWWTQTFVHEYNCRTYNLYYRSTKLEMFGGLKNSGISVRCVKD